MSKHNVRMLRLPAVAALLAISVGCTAAKATYHVIEAQDHLAKAEEFGAPEKAVFEYTMAQRHLEKAREEIGFSEYKDSVLLSQQAAEWADKAVLFIERGGVLEEGEFDGLQDLEVAPAPTGTDAQLAPIEDEPLVAPVQPAQPAGTSAPMTAPVQPAQPAPAQPTTAPMTAPSQPAPAPAQPAPSQPMTAPVAPTPQPPQEQPAEEEAPRKVIIVPTPPPPAEDTP